MESTISSRRGGPKRRDKHGGRGSEGNYCTNPSMIYHFMGSLMGKSTYDQMFYDATFYDQVFFDVAIYDQVFYNAFYNQVFYGAFYDQVFYCIWCNILWWNILWSSDT